MLLYSDEVQAWEEKPVISKTAIENKGGEIIHDTSSNL